MKQSKQLFDLSQFQRTHSRRNSLLHGDGAQTELVACPPTRLGGSSEPVRAYPCLTDNNSINVHNEELKYQKERREREKKYYDEYIKPILTGYQNKSSDLLQYRIEKACEEHGENSIGVLHLTFEKDVDYQTAQDGINSISTNVFRKRYKINELNYFITICEKGGKNGRIHFHILFIKEGADFKTGTRFQYSKKDKEEKIYANDELRAEWEFFRDELPKYKKYGFGRRVRVEPLKSVKGGARYFSKYVGKGHYTRDESMKGKQLIRPSNGFRKYIGTKQIPVYLDGLITDQVEKFTAHQQVSYIGGISSGRRIVLGDVGATHGCSDLKQLNYKLGSHWQHYCKDQMRACASLAGYKIGQNTKEWVVPYVKNQWGVTLKFGSNLSENLVVGAEYQGELMGRTDLYEFALDKLFDRIDEAEEFQYDDRTPIAQNFQTHNNNHTHNNNNETEHNRTELRGSNSETSHFPFRQIEGNGDFY